MLENYLLLSSKAEDAENIEHDSSIFTFVTLSCVITDMYKNAQLRMICNS